jgi:methionyl-tRNA formyltransferase
MIKKKVVVFGCQQIAVDVLKYLSSAPEIEVSLVVTYEVPSDISRGQSSVIDVAKDLGLKSINPKIISNKLIDEIEAIEPDLILSVYYRKVLPHRLINIPKLGAINIHPSALPFYRGPVPTAWAIMNGEKEFGITIHKIDEGIDTGEILLQELFEIKDEDTGYELYQRAMSIGAQLLIKNFNRIINDEFVTYPQSSGGSYYGKLDGRIFIDWRRSAEDIRNQIRVRAEPYNPAEALLMNKYVFINRASIYKETDLIAQRPGRVLKILPKDYLVVSCADGALVLEEYDIYPKLNDIERPIYLKEGNYFSNG